MDVTKIELPDDLDVAPLRTEGEFRAAARLLLPGVLARLARVMAGDTWQKAQDTSRGIGGMSGTPTAAEEERFMGDAARSYTDRSTDDDLLGVEDEIVRLLKDRKARS